MKVNEIKAELEKVSKVIPELRKELDEAYALDSGKKSRIKLIWKEYEDQYKEIRNSRIYKTLQTKLSMANFSIRHTFLNFL
jgi:valyl-tRNA synthetase